MREDKVIPFIVGVVLGALITTGAHGFDRYMRSDREARELEESNLKWEQQVDKAYELGFKAGTLETLQIIEALTTHRKEDR